MLGNDDFFRMGYIKVSNGGVEMKPLPILRKVKNNGTDLYTLNPFIILGLCRP